MKEEDNLETGSIIWTDLTVGNAEKVKDFYSGVIGWKPEPVSMGDYNDFSMNSPDTGRTIAGICHSKGVNADLPPQWLIYFAVKDVDASVELCRRNGGKVIASPRDMGKYGRYCVIQDPAGAVAALFSPKE
ncbi:MAG TPA: VOC family protein [Ignavibacteriaceae bacterium]|nr:VOC family protein [Ignavibacteriaceae bacterium]